MTRRMTRRELVAGSIASGLVSCGRSKARRPRDSSTVTVRYILDPETALGPIDDAPAQFLVFMPLVAWNRAGELEGRLAESWEHSPDYRTWTIRLRDGVRWHDGVPLTSHDIKFTLDLLQHPEARKFAPDSWTVIVLDDRTCTITLHSLNASYTDTGIGDWIACWPKHLLEKLDPKQIDTWPFWAHPVGSGPYRHVRTVPKMMMELEANPDYFRGKPKITKVILKFAGSGAVPELLSGDVDAAPYPQRSDVANVSRDGRFRVYQQPIPPANALWWNHRSALFQDVSVRRALTCAINRAQLLQVLNLPADMRVIDLPVTERQRRRGNYPEPIGYDPELAKRLLDQAGWFTRNRNGIRERNGRPFRFTTIARAGGWFSGSAIYVQDQLRRIGVRMDLTSISDWGLVDSRIKGGQFDAAIMEAPLGRLELLLRGAGYNSPLFFGMLDKVEKVADPDEKDMLIRELTGVAQHDVPLTYLHPFTATTIASTRIRGLENSPYNGDLVQCMDELWLEDVA
jgi:peptide/nickel transport system substrate-binding protein